MRKKTARGAREERRESSPALGWRVEPDPDPAPLPEAPDGAARATAEDLGDPAVPDPSGAAERSEEDDRPQLSNAALVLLGVSGGLYLLYAWVWLSWARYYAESNAAVASSSGALGAVLQQTVFWAAPLAPPLWFLAVLLLNRGSTPRMALWIGIGAILLVPLPVFGGGGS